MQGTKSSPIFIPFTFPRQTETLYSPAASVCSPPVVCYHRNVGTGNLFLESDHNLMVLECAGVLRTALSKGEVCQRAGASVPAGESLLFVKSQVFLSTASLFNLHPLLTCTSIQFTLIYKLD
jgi:hypothetical protein